LRTARERSAAADLDGAVKLYHEILLLEPNHGLALHDLGVLMIRRQKFGSAAELLEQALAVRPSDPACHVDLGEAYRNLGRYRDAAGCCLTAIKLKPKNPEATFTWSLNGNTNLGPAGSTTVKATVTAPKVDHTAWPTAWNDLDYIYYD